MTVEEQRLAEWLEAATPEPPRAVTVELVAAVVARRTPARPRVRVPRWLPAVAAAVVVLVVAALALGLTVQNRSAPPVHPRPSPSSTSLPPPPQASRPPLAIHAWQAAALPIGFDAQTATSTFLDGALYALVGADTRGHPNALFRLDPSTGRAGTGTQRSFIPTPPVFAGGLVWAAGSTALYGMDPATLAVRATVTLHVSGNSAQYPPQLSVSGDTVVFSKGRSVVLVRNRRAVLTIAADGQVSGAALNPDGARVYVAIGDGAGGRLEERDTTTGAEIGTPRPTDPLVDLLATSDGVWATWASGNGAGVSFYPAGGGTPVPAAHGGASGGGQVVGPVESAGVLWLGGDSEVACLDPDTGRVRAHAALTHGDVTGYLSGLTSDGHTLYGTFGLGPSTTIVAMQPPAACFSK